MTANEAKACLAFQIKEDREELTKEEIKKRANEKAKELAQLIGMCNWQECVDKFLTIKQHGEILDLWDTMSGRSCWNDAMRKWLGTI